MNRLGRAPDLHFRAVDIDEAETYGFEGLDIWRRADGLTIQAHYDNEQASIWVFLDVDQVRQLQELLA